MKIHKILFWILILLVTSQIGKHFWPDFSFVLGIKIDYLSPTFYLTDILIIGILFTWLFEKKETVLKFDYFCFLRKNWLLLVFLVYLLAISLIAQNSLASLYKLSKFIEFFILGVYVAKNIDVSFLIKPLVSGLFLEAFLIIIQFLKQGSLNGVFWYLGERNFVSTTPGIALGNLNGQLFLRPYGTFSHPNSLAGFFLSAWFFILFLGKNKKIKLISSILCFFVILITFSRGVWIVGCSILLFWIWTTIKLEKKFILGLVLGVLFLFSTFSLLPRLNDQSFQERLSLFQISNEVITHSWLTGVGLNNFIVVLPNFWPEKEIYFFQPVHNIYCLILAETGLIGFLFFVFFLGKTIKKIYFDSQKLLFLPLGAILLTGLFDHYWLTLQQNQIWFTLILGLCWSSKNDKIL